MNRLQVQLTLAFTLVVLVAVGAIAFLVVRTTDTQFRRYITNAGMRGSGTGFQQLIAYHELQGSWDGVENLLRQGVFAVGPGGTFRAGGDQRPGRPGGKLDVVLADAGGRVVHDSTGKKQGKMLRPQEIDQAVSLTQTADGEVVGYLLLSMPGDRSPLGKLEQQFLDQIRQILILGGALAVAFGLVLGAVLSRRFTAPLQRLASAARAVAGGDLDQRVAVEGSTEMLDVAQAFNEMTTALRESERQRQHMVADVAHELRTPLTVLQGNLRAILDDVYDLDKTEISRLYDETRLLSRLVDDLRELALADAGQLGLHLRPSDVGEIVQSTIESMGPAAEAHQVTLAGQLPTSLPAVRADSDRVAQVLRNLVANALRHTAPGGRVAVGALPTSDGVEIAVEDTGEGIAAEDLPRVFERFWRADPARTRSGGTGLGLAVTQSLVEAQGGRIWAESTPGKGSTFRFTLPVANG